MKKIKIVFFIYRLGGGGAARTMLNIVNHIDKDKFEPILVTLNFDYDYDQYVHENVTFKKLQTTRLRSAIWELATFLKRTKPDILFSTVLTYNIVAILAKFISFLKVKVIVREAAMLGSNSKRESLKLKIAGRLYRTAAKVISLSYGVKDNLIARYNVPREKIKVIYNPVDVQHIAEMQQEPLPKQIEEAIQHYDKVIVNAGRFVKEKDQHSLLQAFAKIDNVYKACLVILGEGELEKSLREEAYKLGIEADVYFAGFQENPYAIFKRANVFVLTSTTEGFGHVLVEALATETIVVSTDCKPGAGEVLVKGKYGLLCEVGHVNDIAGKIEKALQLNANEVATYHKEGLMRANEFAAEEIVKQYENIFQEVVGRKEEQDARKSAENNRA